MYKKGMQFIRVNNTIQASLGVGSIVALARDYDTLPTHPSIIEVKWITREGESRQPDPYEHHVYIRDFIPYNPHITKTKELK